MTRLVWITDIHLDHLTPEQVNAFYARLVASQPDALLITGDIADGEASERYLQQLANTLLCPIYFVLGNHDYHNRSITQSRANIQALASASDDQLQWLNTNNGIELTPSVVLAGHDGWSDGRYGNFFASPIVLSDYQRIHELQGLTHGALYAKLNELGDEAANHLRTVLPPLLEHYPNVMVALHPAPYRESCAYNNQIASEDNPYLPHFSCKAAGDALRDLAVSYPQCQIHVLAGHTHHHTEATILPNLTVTVAGAVYGDPQIAKTFEFLD